MRVRICVGLLLAVDDFVFRQSSLTKTTSFIAE